MNSASNRTTTIPEITAVPAVPVAPLTQKGVQSRERIMHFALQEFAEKGFEKASLRRIAKKSGLTTGAIYGYFESKEGLFDALVSPVGNELLDLMIKANVTFFEQPASKQNMHVMYDFSLGFTSAFLTCIYDHREEVLLILDKSEGTSWLSFIDRLVNIELQSTARYQQQQDRLEHPVEKPVLSEEMSQIFARSYFLIFADIVRRTPRREQAYQKMLSVMRFFHSGYAAFLD